VVEEREPGHGSEPGVVTEILNKEASQSRRGLLAGVWDWTRSILVAFALFLVIRTFLVEAFKIPTSSMENTLLVGDFLLVNKAVYGAEIPGTTVRLPAFASPSRGDVVVFNPPHDPAKNYVKRLVGLPGDTLQMLDKELHVNGAPLQEPYVRFIDQGGDAVHPAMRWQSNHLIASTSPAYQPTRDNWGPLVVPEDRFFMLGDNRDNSEDSRYWGFVARDAIRGRPWFVYYSFDSGRTGGAPWLRFVRWDRIGEAIR
jgi:signal peptidase I